MGKYSKKCLFYIDKKRGLQELISDIISFHKFEFTQKSGKKIQADVCRINLPILYP